jgi:hypothetical protein
MIYADSLIKMNCAENGNQGCRFFIYFWLKALTGFPNVWSVYANAYLARLR